MKHTALYLKIMLIMSIFAVAGVQAQQVEINSQLIMPPNPSANLSDWQSNPQTVILNTMVAGNYPRPVKLMASCSLNGQIVARTKFDMMKPITLHQGMNTFNAIDLVPYSAVEFTGNIDQSAKRTGKLPEGQYQFCIAFVDAETNTPIPGSACNPFGVQNVNPPTLVSPANGTQFLTNNTQTTRVLPVRLTSMTINELGRVDGKTIGDLQGFNLISGNTQTPYVQLSDNIGDQSPLECGVNQRVIYFTSPSTSNNSLNAQSLNTLNFQWLPPVPMTPAPIQYHLRIVPVYPGQTVEQALQIGTSLFEKDGITGLSFIPQELNAEMFERFKNQGMSFTWSVQAHDMNGNGIGVNNGWAIPSTFFIDDLPPFINNKVINDFFDIFCDVDIPPVPCGKHATFVELKFGPWREGKGSTSNIYVNWERNVYKVYRIIDCGLEKGHSGPHHGSSYLVYVLDHVDKSKQGGTTPPPSTPPASMDDEPAKKDQISKGDLQKILDNDKPSTGDTGGTGTDNGQNSGTGSTSGNNGGNNGTGAKVDSGGKNGTTNGTQTDKEPCGYKWRFLKDKFKTKCYFSFKPTKGNYQDIYEVWALVTCSLEKGHGGNHEGTVDGKVYVKVATIPCGDSTGADLPVHSAPMSSSVITKDSLEKIPDTPHNSYSGGVGTSKTDTTKSKKLCGVSKAIKVNDYYTECVDGYCQHIQEWVLALCILPEGHSGPHYFLDDILEWYTSEKVPCDSAKGHATGPIPPKDQTFPKNAMDTVKTIDQAKAVAKDLGLVLKVPCPEIKKTLLRTIVGSWKKGATVIRHATYRKTTMAWADVTWIRDIWNVYLVQHCTLEKDHAGPHVWDAGHEEWQKYGTITDKVTYGVGEPQTEPTTHWSDAKDVPHEDPPRNAIYMK
jgi:hypothetical protein